MEEVPALRLCTFEVSTPIGRHRRLGNFRDGRICDLNFATAWYMAQTGEAEPHRMADALVPADLPMFLRTGLRAIFTSEELFLGSGPVPHDWWTGREPYPRGPNDETLVYEAGEVRLMAPLPGYVAPEAEVPAIRDCMAWMAAVIGVTGVVGYTIGTNFGSLGPHVVTGNVLADEVKFELRVNGQVRAEAKVPKFPATGSPGDVSPPMPHVGVTVSPGDVVEVEAEGLGVLRHRVTTA